ncbi:MAG TPA: hypothetical protein VGF25_21055 [Thermoleophilaceae bacterium]|jgi:hypothetical protein
MTSFAKRCLIVALPVLAASLTAFSAAASAATLSVGVSCARYIPAFAGQEWIPVTGAGFTPNPDPTVNTVELGWPGGDLAGFAPAATNGSFTKALLMPTDFIRTGAGRTKTYTLTATDRLTPGLVASAPVTFVRAGVSVRPSHLRRNLSRKVRWSTYGAPTGAKLYGHWTFKGRKKATRSFGRARGACGISHKRAPFLPTRPRNGTWKVYVTIGKRFSRKKALFRVDLNVFSFFSSRAADVR